MVWAILFGYLFFSERPDVIVLVGAGFILAGSWMVSRRQ
jgi:drug/metabolite transporter (DMT)-like permease